jgi:hypothetical protein
MEPGIPGPTVQRVLPEGRKKIYPLLFALQKNDNDYFLHQCIILCWCTAHGIYPMRFRDRHLTQVDNSFEQKGDSPWPKSR